MQKYFLAPDTYCCEIDDGAIFLELITHKYFAIGSQSLHALRRAVQDWPTAGHPKDDPLDRADEAREPLEELARKGLLTRSEPAGRLSSPTIAVAEDSLATINRSELDHTIRVRDAVRFAMAYLRTTRDLRLARLKVIVRRIETRRIPRDAGGGSGDVQRVRRLVKMFLRLRPWIYSSKSACLLDSIVLMEFLAHYRITPTLVIGVNTKPFTAHAWVQLGTVVLNDTPEHVHEYTPILLA